MFFDSVIGVSQMVDEQHRGQVQEIDDAVSACTSAIRSQIFRAFNAGRDAERRRSEEWRKKAQELAQKYAALDRQYQSILRQLSKK